jgi:hypothetical protein
MDKTRKILLCTLVIFFTGIGLGAATVDESELKKDAFGEIIFTDYVGPYLYINTIDEIFDVGKDLGSSLQPGEGVASYGGKYRVIRVLDSDAEGLGADIFLIEPSAQVDSILNLRRILAGYLMSNFSYSEDDAMTLAEVLTKYNAVHRGDVEYFQGIYEPDVTSQLSEDKAGLSTLYSDWAGGTQMLIPLRESFSGDEEKAIDSLSLTDEETVQDMEDEGEGLQLQKDVVEIAEKDLQEEKLALEEQKEELEEEEKAIEQELKQIESDPGDTPEERQEQEERKQELEDRQNQIEREQQQIEKTEDRIAQEEERLQDQQQEIAQKEQERITTQEPEATTPQSVVTKPVYFYRLVNSDTGQLVLVDGVSGRALAESRLNTLRGRRFEFLGDGILVIAGINQGNTTAKFYLLDKESLEITDESDAETYGTSFLLLKGQEFYGVVKADDGSWTIGRFNASLKIQAKGSVTVNPDTAMTFADGKVYFQEAGGGIGYVDATTLQ